jgi:hypothetical protein
MTWDMGRPLALSEVTAGPTYTGAQPTKLESEAAAQANTDWVLIHELDRRAAVVTAARRDWIRTNVVSAATPPPGGDSFIARNFHFLTDLHCPASMDVAAQLLGTDKAKYEDLEAIVDIDDRPAVVTLAMVIAAFEWNTARRSWRAGELADDRIASPISSSSPAAAIGSLRSNKSWPATSACSNSGSQQTTPPDLTASAN